MSNMSYCRFQNTLVALEDCQYALEEGEDTDMSESEKSARRQLILLCRDIVQDYEDLLEE